MFWRAIVTSTVYHSGDVLVSPHPTMTTGQSWRKLAHFPPDSAFLVSGSLTITKCQGWRLFADGAILPASMTLPSASSGMGVGRYFLTDLLFLIASRTSIVTTEVVIECGFMNVVPRPRRY